MSAVACSSHVIAAIAAITGPASRRATTNTSHVVARWPIAHSPNADASPDNPSCIGSSNNQENPGGQTVSGAGTWPNRNCDS